MKVDLTMREARAIGERRWAKTNRRRLAAVLLSLGGCLMVTGLVAVIGGRGPVALVVGVVSAAFVAWQTLRYVIDMERAGMDFLIEIQTKEWDRTESLPAPPRGRSLS